MAIHEPYSPGFSKDQGLVKQLQEFQKNPRSLVFVALAENYRKRGLLQQADEILNEGLVVHPDLSSALLLKAKIAFDQKKYASALDQLERLLQKNQDNVRAHKFKAEIFLRLGQRRAAMRALESVLRLFPQDLEAVKSLEELENLESDVKVDVRKISTVSSDSLRTSGKVEEFHVCNLHGPGARIETETLISEASAPMDEEDAVGQMPAIATRTIAELYLRQGLKKRAVAVLRRMLEEDPGHVWARESLQELEINGIVPQKTGPVRSPRERLEAKARVLETMLMHFQSLRQS